jgi:cytochrome c551
LRYKILLITGVAATLLLAGCSTAGQQQGQQQEEQSSSVAETPQEVFANNCSACHGGNLQGGYGPSLQKIGSKLNKEQIMHVIENGEGQMPPQTQVPKEAREKLAAWLAQKK